MRKGVLISFLLCLSMCAFAQSNPNPPTNSAEFSVGIGFLGSTAYGQSNALDVASTTAFTADTLLRLDIFSMPGAGYTGYFGGAQYTPPAICNLLATTALSCGKINPYVGGEVGLGRIQSQTSPTVSSIAGLARVGMNYDPTGTGRFTINLFEANWASLGPGARSTWSGSFGILAGLGSNAAQTEAKLARWRTAKMKKDAKLTKKMLKDGTVVVK